jgi:4-amino-4-deoxy-L-arabinose transferase-like glycosyltransferase
VKAIHKTWLTDLLFISLFFAIAYGAFLGSYPLFIPDDARYVEISREMARSGDYLTPRLDGLKYFEKPPLFYWLDALAIEAGGNSLWVGRSVNALFALLGCVLIYAAGRCCFDPLKDDRLKGWLAAGILGSSLLYIVLARYVTLDMTFTFCLSACLLTFLRGYLLPPGLNKRGWCYAAYSFAALAVLAKGLAGIVLPIGVIGAWVLLRWDWRSLRYFYIPTGLLLFFIIALPWHILMQLEHPEFFDYYIIFHHFLRYATLSAERFEPFWFFIPIIIVGLLPWAGLLPETTRTVYKQWRSDPTISFLLVWIIVIFVFFSISKSKLVPYILPVFTPMVLLIAHYLDECYQKKEFPFKALYSAAVVASILLIAALTSSWWFPEKLLRYQDMLPYIRGIVLFYLIGILVCVALWKKQKLLPGIATLAISSILAVSTALVTLEPFINSKSTKEFADYLQPILKADDMVIAYNNFYYDLPYYLDREIMLTHAGGELQFGAEHEPQNPLLITSAEVWQRWDTPQRIFIVTKPEMYAKFQQEGRKMWLVAETSRAVLFTNHESSQ